MRKIIEQQQKRIRTISGVVPPVNNNQLEEIEYFNAYLLPLSEKSNIQNALSEYGSIRLEKGDYSGVDLVLSSNQKIYGHPSSSQVSNITISAGSTGIVLENLVTSDKNIVLESGAVISNCVFKSIRFTIMIANNASFTDNTFINYGAPIRWNCSTSGYFRNNKIIKHQSGTVSNLLIMKGNSTTPSYGNVHLHTNFLTPHGDTTDIDRLQTTTFVGIDAESWNYTNEGSRAMFYANNMGNIKITDFNGGNGGSPYKTPSFDIDSDDVFFLGKSNSYPTDSLALKTNMFLINGLGTYVRDAGTVTGFDLQGNLEYSNVIKYNGVEQTSKITDVTTINKLITAILGGEHTPWSRPYWEELPNPLGDNWRINRVGKPDQREYIQNLINNGIADLPEGVFYIGSSLEMPMDNAHGVIGKGTAKTVIVGLTDDFPLITLKSGADGSFTIANITLQGGSIGVLASTDFGNLNIAYQNMKFVIFRDQNYGIHLRRTGGFDNNFLENVGFVNCNIGFYQEPTPGSSEEGNSAYVDKTMFYKNQFINCNTAISMIATRADNLNAWVDCKFKGGTTALSMASQNCPIVANSDFSNYNGANIIRSNAISMYNSRAYENSVTGSTINTIMSNIEGCEFLDNSPLFSPVLFNTLSNHIVNSKVTGNVATNIPDGQGFGKESAIYVNNDFSSNPSLSKLLVNVKNGVPLVLIDEETDAYPQLLVTQ